MSAFFGVARYEYRMAVRRWGLWIAYAVAGLPYILSALLDPIEYDSTVSMWPFAGSMAFNLNLLLPIIGGIVMADRLARDFRLGTRELLAATPLSRRTYVLGKYVGVVAATVTPVLVIIVLLAAVISARGLTIGVPPLELATMTGAFLIGFAVIIVPAYLFVGAFSLACPAVLPVRVYQVLYTGYWFWGNFLNPKFIPTLAGTLLMPSGEFAAGAFFGADRAANSISPFTTAQAVLNITVLMACAAGALLALERYLAWQERGA